MANNVDISQLKSFQKKLEALSKNGFAEAEKDICNELAARTLRIAIKNTPYISGHLKGSYRTSAVYPTGDGYTVTIYNPVKYAPYVEYGHRTRGGGGWVPGKYMLTKATDSVNNMADKIIEKRIMEELKKLWK